MRARVLWAASVIGVSSVVLTPGCMVNTHVNVPARQFVHLRWQAALDPYGGYFIRHLPAGGYESHWKVPPGKAFILTDYACHLYGGTAGQTEAVQVKKYNTSLDAPYHVTAVTLGPDGGTGVSVHLTSGVVVAEGTELMFRLTGTAGGIPKLDNWASVDGYLVDL